MMSNFGCMLYQKGKDVKMLSKSETRNVTMNLYGNEEKCIGTQLCGPQTCVPMFLFVILSFCHFVIFVIFVAKGVEGNACLLEF